MINKITKSIQEGDNWLSNSTFNDLLKQMKEMRLTDQGFIELCFEEGVKLGVDLEPIFWPHITAEKPCFVLVMYLIKDDKFLYEWDSGSKKYQIL